MVAFKVVISIFLLIGVISPKFTWQITEGWKYKKAEPNAFYLVMGRIVSIILLLLVWTL